MKCHPLWSFKAVDQNSAATFGWHLASGDAGGQILQFLTDLGGTTWGELRGHTTGGGHRKHHEHAIAELPKDAQDRLSTIEKDDHEDLFRFRVTGECRLWGIVIDEVFYALWWDPNHQVYPTEKS